MPKQPIIFVLDDQRDADLLAWLESKHNRSEAIRNALRAAMRAETDGGQTAVIAEAVSATLASELGRLPGLVERAIRDVLASYRLMSLTPGETTEEEPAVAAANLDSLLERLANGALD